MCSCENGKYVENIIDDSVIDWNEIIKTTISTSTRTVPAKSTSTNFYILVTFLLITI